MTSATTMQLRIRKAWSLLKQLSDVPTLVRTQISHNGHSRPNICPSSPLHFQSHYLHRRRCKQFYTCLLMSESFLIFCQRSCLFYNRQAMQSRQTFLRAAHNPTNITSTTHRSHYNRIAKKRQPGTGCGHYKCRCQLRNGLFSRTFRPASGTSKLVPHFQLRDISTSGLARLQRVENAYCSDPAIPVSRTPLKRPSMIYI